MKVKCAECGKRYRIKDSLVAPAGIKVRCPNCNFVIPIYPDLSPDTKLNSQQKTVADSSATHESTSNMQDETTPYSGGDSEEELDESLIQPSHPSEYEATNVQSEQISIQNSQIDVPLPLNSHDEISLPGEISQISFDSDATFKDVEERLDKPAKEKVAAKVSAPVPQAATAINPNKPQQRAQFSDPVSNGLRAREEPTPTPTQKHHGLGQRKGFSWISFLVLAILAVLAFYALRGLVPEDIRQLVTRWRVKVVPPEPTPVITEPQIELAAEDQQLVDAALNLSSKPALDFISSTLAARTSHPGTTGWLAYIQSLAFLLYNEEASRERGLNYASRALLEFPNDPRAIWSRGVLNSTTNNGAVAPETTLQQLAALQERGKIRDDFILFFRAIVARATGDTAQAWALISSAMQKRSNYAPFVQFALLLPNLDGAQKQQLKAVQEALRQEVVVRRPDYKVFLDQPEPPVLAQPTPIPTKTPKPAPAETLTTPAPTKRPVAKRPIRTTPGSINNEPSSNKSYQVKELIAKADQLFQREQYNEALVQYQSAQKIAGDRDAVLLIRLGQTWFKLYRLDEAYNHFNRAVQIDANQADAHKGLGMVYDQLGDLDKAAREYSLYLQLKPNANDAAEIRETLKKLKP